jgi:molybdopterin-containing oxidoreductase family iron-sulfur binding subunit
MQKNPDVTVRMRGVMEKCSYCIQRTNAAKVETRLQDLNYVPDGFVQSACQQACPSDSIIFGDILDATNEYKDAGGTRKGSRVHAARLSRRSYLLLGYLNTRPRTSHLLKVSNPNPALVTNEHRRAAWDHPFHDGGSHGGGGDGHGGGKEGNKEHAFFDERRKREDKGYALSLGVLSSAAGLSSVSAIGGGLA